MAATAYDASFLDFQETWSEGGDAKDMAFQHVIGTNYGMGKVTAIWSEEDSVAGGGAVGDTLDFFKLPDGTLIVGGWLYTEDGFGGSDGELADLGVIYEDSDGTDDADCLIDGADIYDGADGVGTIDALPAGTLHKVGSDVAAFPYKVDGGWGTVRLTAMSGDFVTAKDVKLVLYVILPY